MDHRSKHLSQCTYSLEVEPDGVGRIVRENTSGCKVYMEGERGNTHRLVGLCRRTRRPLIAAQVGVVATIDEVVGDGLGKVFLVRQWSLDCVEPILKHQDVSEFMVPVSRLVQPGILLTLGFA